MSRHRYAAEPHAEVDLFDELVPPPRSATAAPDGTAGVRPERAGTPDFPVLPSPRVSQSGPMSPVEPRQAVPAPRVPVAPITEPATGPIVVPVGDIEPSDDVELTDDVEPIGGVEAIDDVEPTAASRPVEQVRRADVTEATELLHPDSATGPASLRERALARTHRAPDARPGKPALVACAVLGLVVGATASVAVGRTFWGASDRTTTPAQVVAAPPLLTPAPVAPAPPAIPSSPRQEPDATRQKAKTDRPGGAAKPDVLAQGPVRNLHIWLTGYSFQDNTPPSSATVSAPILHKVAGGTGTFTDPITVAVPGHASDGDMAWKGGTRFYLPTVQRYVIVEDSGASPAPSGQDGHLDMWVDGQGGSKSASDNCMDRITGTGIPAIMNPPPGKPVLVGPITSNGTCHIPAGTGSSD